MTTLAALFLLGVPVMALLLVLGPILLPEYRDPNAGKLDPISAAMSLASVLLVILGLKQIAQDGFRWLPSLAILAGFTVGALFVRRERAATLHRSEWYATLLGRAGGSGAPRAASTIG